MKYFIVGFILLCSSSLAAQEVDSYRLSPGAGDKSDAELQRIVSQIVTQKMEDSGANVIVTVKNAHVIFSGTVETGSQRYVLHSLAQKIDGIKSFEINTQVE